MSPQVLKDLSKVLEQLDAAEEFVGAAQLQMVIDTLERVTAAQQQAAQIPRSAA